MSTRLALRSLSVNYRRSTRPALDGVSFDLVAGEKLAVIGESGSGKSTLALAVAGLLPRDTLVSGTAEWPELRRAPLPGRDYGFVFQDPAGSLDPVMTVGRQVAEVALVHLGLSWRDALARADELLARVGLPGGVTGAFPHQLSGGQKQRVALAAAIVARPSLLIADEATSALDTIVQAGIMELIGKLVADEKMSLLFISHDIALAARIADRIGVFKDGHLIELGSASQLVARPRDPYTRLLVEAARDPALAGVGS